MYVCIHIFKVFSLKLHACTCICVCVCVYVEVDPVNSRAKHTEKKTKRFFRSLPMYTNATFSLSLTLCGPSSKYLQYFLVYGSTVFN